MKPEPRQDKMTRRGALGALSLGGSSVAGAGAGVRDGMEAGGGLLRREVEAGRLRGAVLDVRRGTETIQQAFGDAGQDSMFLLGSITKPFTAVAAMVLVDRGQLRLADRVVDHVPEFSEGARRDVTVEQLLVHTSGLPDQLPDNDALRARHAPLSEFVAGACRVSLLFPPGTRYHYQSMGILLVAEIVERISGVSLPGFLEEHVFSPLGMSRTVLGVGRFPKSDLMRMQTDRAAPESGGGNPDAADWDWNSDYWRTLAAPWGGGHGSAGDLARFLGSFLRPDGTVLRPETARLMIGNHTPGLGASRGLGFMVGSEGFGPARSERTFGHSGSTGTLAWADPATDTSLVLLTTLPKIVSGESILRPVSELVPR